LPAPALAAALQIPFAFPFVLAYVGGSGKDEGGVEGG